MSEGKRADLDRAAREYGRLWSEAYDECVSRTFESTHRTIKEAMLSHLSGAGGALPLIRYKDTWISRSQADKEACRLANALLDCGVVPGDRVGIVVSNRPENVISFMACYKAGFVAAAYNQRCTAREIVGALEGVEASALIIEQEHVSKVLSAIGAGKCPDLSCIVVIDNDDAWADAGGCLELHGYEPLLRTASDLEPAIDVSPHDDAILLFTGGTTGVSKGCAQTHEAMVWELQAMRFWTASALTTPDPSFLVCMPMTHIMGINYGVNWQLINGGSVVIAEGYKPPDIIAALERYRPTAWAALPTLLHSVSTCETLAASPYKDLELVIFGGSFVAKNMLEDLASKTRARFVESYGMSESFGFVTCNPVGSMGKMGSIGLPISNTDVLAVDLESGTQALAPGVCGEIVFRGPQIIRSYWANPEETQRALRGGWLYSGDIGYMDEDGFFYLVDRKKDTIVVSGFNVFPSEIDEVLMSHPSILDACTIGVPDEHSGERPKSFIVVRGGADVALSEIESFCRERLVAYKIPHSMEVLDEIPKTKAKKPDRAFLKREEARKRGVQNH
ncbi:class I adenylate-forming enzyme family protein [Raoultibacter phocaeensis]|uniref:class I adenylate-forming enzyme family protein n=1 Tax=Raoultibacter phocaeensis TaxID=2479841 RepID=UPI001118466C|nr:class I adenylate-forming enzyme family protein [Raoultibacter phocaeensis]